MDKIGQIAQAALEQAAEQSLPGKPAREVYECEECEYCRGYGFELTDKGAKPCRHLAAAEVKQRLVGLLPKYQDQSLETLRAAPAGHPNHHPKQRQVIEQLNQNPYLSYLICGKNGMGKSTYGQMLYRRALEEARPAVAITLAELLGQMRDFKSEAVITPAMVRQHKERQFVFIDEFGKTGGRVTEFASGSLHSLIQACEESNAQLVLAANKTKEDLSEYWSQADPEYGPSIMRKVLQKKGAFYVDLF